MSVRFIKQQRRSTTGTRQGPLCLSGGFHSLQPTSTFTGEHPKPPPSCRGTQRCEAPGSGEVPAGPPHAGGEQRSC